MGSLLVLLYNVRSFVINLSYNYLYLHDLCPAVLDIKFIISLIYYYMFCMVIKLVLVNFYMLQYSYVCHSMMSVNSESVGSARNTIVSLINVDMVSELNKCCWMSSFLKR